MEIVTLLIVTTGKKLKPFSLVHRADRAPKRVSQKWFEIPHQLQCLIFYQQKDAYETESNLETNLVLFKKKQTGKVQFGSSDIPSFLFALSVAETKKDFLAASLLFWMFQKKKYVHLRYLK